MTSSRYKQRLRFWPLVAVMYILLCGGPYGIEEIVPQLAYRHPHNPGHVKYHILSSIIGPSLTIPIEKGELVLGPWQKIILIEFNGPRERTIAVNFIL